MFIILSLLTEIRYSFFFFSVSTITNKSDSLILCSAFWLVNIIFCTEIHENIFSFYLSTYLDIFDAYVWTFLKNKNKNLSTFSRWYNNKSDSNLWVWNLNDCRLVISFRKRFVPEAKCVWCVISYECSDTSFVQTSAVTNSLWSIRNMLRFSFLTQQFRNTLIEMFSRCLDFSTLDLIYITRFTS